MRATRPCSQGAGKAEGMSAKAIPVDYGETGRRARTIVVFALLIALLVVFLLLNLCIGSVEVTVPEVLAALFGGDSSSLASDIIWEIRFPRLVACVVLGAALALSGFLLQTFFNNPIASPFTLGVSSGSKLVVAFAMVVVLGTNAVMAPWMMIVSAFAGALLTMGFVLLVSRRIRSSSMLIVAGVMIGYICSAATDFLVTFADEQNIVNLRNWSLGSFSGISWTDVGIMSAVGIAASVAVFLLAKPIGAYQLGESYAQSMGVNVRAFRVVLIVLSSLLAGCVTAFAGPISFVGIAVPHIVKSMLRSSKPIRVIPACFLGGAIFCLGCDLIARTAFAPTELSVSTVTAVFGAPVVIAIMLKKRKRR